MDETEFAKLFDELAVRKVLDEYSLRLELNAFEDWLDLFTEDTVYEVFRRSLQGRDELSAMLSQAPHGVHIGGPARVTLDGDRAETIQSYVFIPNSIDQWNSGWYYRTLLRVGDEWKIAHTKVKVARTDNLPPNDKAKTVVFPIIFES